MKVFKIIPLKDDWVQSEHDISTCKQRNQRWRSCLLAGDWFLFHLKSFFYHHLKCSHPKSVSTLHFSVQWYHSGLSSWVQQHFSAIKGSVSSTPLSAPMGWFPRKQPCRPMMSAAELGPQIVLWYLNATVVQPRPPSSTDFYHRKDRAKRHFSWN